jgi:hypothetical protein
MREADLFGCLHKQFAVFIFVVEVIGADERGSLGSGLACGYRQFTAFTNANSIGKTEPPFPYL